jgi:hypothetical protein
VHGCKILSRKCFHYLKKFEIYLQTLKFIDKY